MILGGEADAEDKFIPFTVVVDPSPDSAVMQVTSATSARRTAAVTHGDGRWRSFSLLLSIGCTLVGHQAARMLLAEGRWLQKKASDTISPSQRTL